MRWLVGVLAVLLPALVAATGCTGPRPPAPDLTAEVVVGRSGGVAGLRELLRVRPDGVAVQVGGRAGRLGAERLAALRARLADPALRDEAVAVARGDDDVRCSDVVTRSLTVGTFSMSVTDACGSERRPRTPVFDAVLALLADPSSGRFDEALRPGDVPRVTLRTQRAERTGGGGDGPYAVTAAPDGSLTLTRPGAPDRRARLDDETRDALALTGAGLLGQAATACPGSAGATVEVVGEDGRRTSGTACVFGPRTVDAIAVHRALAAPFDLD